MYKCIIHLLLVTLWSGSVRQFLICCKVGFNIGNGMGLGHLGAMMSSVKLVNTEMKIYYTRTTHGR